MNGVDPMNLMSLTLKHFQGKNIPEEVAQIKFEHYERRRKENVEECLATRAAIIRRQEGPKDTEPETDNLADGQESVPKIRKSASMPVFQSSKPKLSTLEKEMERLKNMAR